ncbi:MAG: hypothetical protein CSA52_00130 [Gammaproteobacteria bacterium]|nr:MAG: hypothetical protein CSB48_07020 [Pseudomonadota bacterium]PIE38992.1 MAG: hypothetical protein CSA52_00130 [Gammaproteobacteria bacterium]
MGQHKQIICLLEPVFCPATPANTGRHRGRANMLYGYRGFNVLPGSICSLLIENTCSRLRDLCRAGEQLRPGAQLRVK